MSYFLLAVSNRENLNLCIRYSIAGFPNTLHGFWTFNEIEEGDKVSFMYGARIFNLYEVVEKVAIENAEEAPPYWKPLKFGKKVYNFPFRLLLKPLRELNESMVRVEFSYVAENLMLRGGYRKTHFQADTSTFYAVSKMGNVWKSKVERLDVKYERITPTITFVRKTRAPYIFRFHELLLQAIVRRHLANPQNLQDILNRFDPSLEANDFEVLGEKAFPEGHVDIFIKEKHPEGVCRKIVVEVKKGRARKEDLSQLLRYVEEIRDECLGGILICSEFPTNVLRLMENFRETSILPLAYEFEGLAEDEEYTFEELLRMIRLESPEA